MVSKYAVFGVTLLLSTLFVQAAVVFRPPFGILSLSPFWVCGFLILVPKAPPVNKIGAMGWLLLVLVLLETVSLLRGFRAGSLDSGLARYQLASLLTLAVFSIAGFWTRGSERHAGQSIKLIWSSVVLFVLVNVALLGVGYRGESAPGGAVLLGAMGIAADRAAFVLSRGANSFGVPAGATMVIGLMLVPTRWKGARSLLGAALAICLGMVGILAIDSRAALGVSVIAVILTKLSLRVSVRYVAWLPIGMPIVTFVLMAGSGLLFDNTGVSEVLGRTSVSDLGTLNSRILIWQPAIVHLGDFEPVHTVGYGSYGQLTSGVSRDYVMFAEVDDYLHLSLHNTYLQQVLDTGYLGLGVLFTLLAMGLTRMSSLHRTNPEIGADVMLALLIYYVLYGNLEIAASGYHEGFTLFLLLLFFSASPGARPESSRSSVV